MTNKCIATVVAGAMAVGALAGCESVERETGVSKTAQTTAVLGAATGGLIAGVAGAGSGWIAFSALGGLLAGGLLGEYLTDDDKDKAVQANANAVQNQSPGERTTWTNPDTGHRGSTDVNQEFRDAEGRLCKTFTQTVVVEGQTEKVEGVACQQADGSWMIKNS
ncbi:MAG: RT0821/Lpp0805 family surface protein [Kiloniellales bacterium]|nr:RT0821/Lpp0805 family surface protein [Kiloniellales bacterium]